MKSTAVSTRRVLSSVIAVIILDLIVPGVPPVTSTSLIVSPTLKNLSKDVSVPIILLEPETVSIVPAPVTSPERLELINL